MSEVVLFQRRDYEHIRKAIRSDRDPMREQLARLEAQSQALRSLLDDVQKQHRELKQESAELREIADKRVQRGVREQGDIEMGISIEKMASAVEADNAEAYTAAEYQAAFEQHARGLRQAGESLSMAMHRARGTAIGKALVRGTHTGSDDRLYLAQPGRHVGKRARPESDDATQEYLRKVAEIQRSEELLHVAAFDEARRRYPQLARRMNAERDGSWNDAA